MLKSYIKGYIYSILNLYSIIKNKKCQLWGLLAKELFIGLIIGLIIGFVLAVLIAKGIILPEMNFICPTKP